MSDYDPKYRDPNRLQDLERSDYQVEREAGGYWGWIIGGVAALALIIAAVGYSRDNSQTADIGATTDTGAATTGSNAPMSTPANPRRTTPPTANAPANPPSTTGQSSQ